MDQGPRLTDIHAKTTKNTLREINIEHGYPNFGGLCSWLFLHLNAASRTNILAFLATRTSINIIEKQAPTSGWKIVSGFGRNGVGIPFGHFLTKIPPP